MKIIFLDIDGVLNSVKTCTAHQEFPHDFSDMKLFDNTAIALIRRICDQTKAKIVVSSTWRRSFQLEDIAKALDLPIIDKTPSLLSAESRGEEIEFWLNEHLYIQYCIIDDDSDMLGCQNQNFVQTCRLEGFSLKNYNQVINILNGR